jgi:hypothetical protein
MGLQRFGEFSIRPLTSRRVERTTMIELLQKTLLICYNYALQDLITNTLSS